MPDTSSDQHAEWETGAFTCPASEDGEHGLEWAGEWFCPSCSAVLSLGIWLHKRTVRRSLGAIRAARIDGGASDG